MIKQLITILFLVVVVQAFSVKYFYTLNPNEMCCFENKVFISFADKCLVYNKTDKSFSTITTPDNPWTNGITSFKKGLDNKLYLSKGRTIYRYEKNSFIPLISEDLKPDYDVDEKGNICIAIDNTIKIVSSNLNNSRTLPSAFFGFDLNSVTATLKGGRIFYHNKWFFDTSWNNYRLGKNIDRNTINVDLSTICKISDSVLIGYNHDENIIYSAAGDSICKHELSDTITKKMYWAHQANPLRSTSNQKGSFLLGSGFALLNGQKCWFKLLSDIAAIDDAHTIWNYSHYTPYLLNVSIQKIDSIHVPEGLLAFHSRVISNGVNLFLFDNGGFATINMSDGSVNHYDTIKAGNTVYQIGSKLETMILPDPNGNCKLVYQWQDSKTKKYSTHVLTFSDGHFTVIPWPEELTSYGSLTESAAGEAISGFDSIYAVEHNGSWLIKKRKAIPDNIDTSIFLGYDRAANQWYQCKRDNMAFLMGYFDNAWKEFPYTDYYINKVFFDHQNRPYIIIFDENYFLGYWKDGLLKKIAIPDVESDSIIFDTYDNPYLLCFYRDLIKVNINNNSYEIIVKNIQTTENSIKFTNIDKNDNVIIKGGEEIAVVSLRTNKVIHDVNTINSTILKLELTNSYLLINNYFINSPKIFTIDGRMIKCESTVTNLGTYMNISKIAKGLYLLRFAEQGKVHSMVFLKP